MIISLPQAENKPEILNLHDRMIITQRFKILTDFVSKMEERQQELPPEYDELVSEHFWDLA